MSLQLAALPIYAQYHSDNFIEKLLKKHPERFAAILQNPEKYKVQVLYTKIDRNKNNIPHFTTHGYRVNTGEYFYPASTVMLPAVALAFEKMNK
ncbi:MAG: hypothetical protein ACO1N1_15865, partial [Dyadobacter fermentans]